VAVAIALLKKDELGDLEGGLALLREAVEAARRNPDVRAEHRELYTETLQEWEALQAAVAAAGVAFNHESPWVMATNGGRRYYWRNDPFQSSLQAPAEGVKNVRAEDDDEFEEGFAKAEATQAALAAAGVALNHESPWIMATNGGRRYYWRNGPSQSSLQAPAEGVQQVQAEDDDEFEKSFAGAE
jgi:hypothetical protein